jgi:hypothetical protein
MNEFCEIIAIRTKKKKSTHIDDEETGTQEEIYNNIKK